MPQTTQMTTDQFMGTPAQEQLTTPTASQDTPIPITPSAIPDNSKLPVSGFRSASEARALLERMKGEGKMTIADSDKADILSDLQKGAVVNIGGVEDKPSKKVTVMSSEQFLGTPPTEKESETKQALKGTMLNTLIGIQQLHEMPVDMAMRVFHTLTQKTEPGRAMTPDESTIAKNLGYGDKKWGSTSTLSADDIKNAARVNPEVPGILNKWGKDIGGETGEFLSNLSNVPASVANNSIPAWLSKINPAEKERVRYAQVQSILASSQMLAAPEGHTKEQLDAALEVMKQYKEDSGRAQQSTLDAVKEMGTSIKEHPGQAAAGFANALTADPELIVAPIATAGRVGKALEGANAAARTAAKAGAGAVEGATINAGAFAAQEAGNPEGNITASGLKSNAAIGGVMGGVLGALAPNHVAPKVKERIGPPEGPIPKNPIPELHPDTGTSVKPVSNAQKARFAELQAISKGTPDTQVTGLDGKPVTVPGSKGRIFTPEEKAEYDSLKKTVPAATNDARQRALNTALDKYGEAMAKGDADALEAANESIGKLNSADPTISDAEAATINRANKPRIKVGPDGKPIEATPAETAPTPQAKTEGAPTLPSTLSKANPTYFFGNKRFAPEFANDVDKAAYIIAGKNPSKSDAKFLKFVQDATGMDEPAARAYGATVRASMKQFALSNKGGKMPVPDHFSKLGDAGDAGAVAPSAAPSPATIPENIGSGTQGAQSGRIDPDLLKALAVHSGLVAAGATAGAIAYPDDKKAGALIGGLAGLGVGAVMHMGTHLQGGDRTIPAGQRGIIGGVEGVAKDPVKTSYLEHAKNMLAKNAIPSDVWSATGWYLDKDNSWKWEIPDQHASINRQGIYDGVVEGRTLKLSELLDHAKLSEAYPEIAKDTKVKFERLPKTRRGSVGDDGTITLNSDLNTFKDGLAGGPDSVLGTILHEVTHKVQVKEGHARGGNPDAATALPHYEEAINNEFKRLKNRGIDPDTLTMGQLESIYKHLGHQTYLRLKGEVEARSVQRRMSMNDYQRASTSPEETQHGDVPRGEQIVSYDGQNAASIIDDMQARKDALEKAKESHALLVKAAEGSDNPDAAAILKQSTADIKAKEKALGELRSSKNSMPELPPVRDTLDLPNQDAVIEGVKAGDPRSQAALYNHFAPILKKYASSFASTIKENGSQLPLDPGELAHVALTKGLQHIDMYKGDSALGTWLISILRNEALGELRKGESRIKPTSIFSGNPNESGAAAELSSKSLGGGEISEGTGGSGLKPGIEKKLSTDETPESNLSNKQTQKILSRTFAKMGESQRKAMEDFYFNDKSTVDIAKDAGVPEGTVRQWLNRGRDKVKEAIEKDNIAYKGVYNPITGKQGGMIDPKLMIEMGKKLAIAGVGATIGMNLSNKDSKIKGALQGAGLALLAGAISPRAAVDGIRNAMKPGKRISMSSLANTHEVEIARASRYIAQVKFQLETLAPNASSRERITRYLDGEKLPLSVSEMKAANMAKQFFAQVGKLGLDAGVLKDTIENYVTHLWGRTKENQSVIDELLKSHTSGLSTESNFSLKRVFPSIKAGEKAGLTPQTLDISSILGIYGDSIVKAVANKRLLAGLRSTDVEGLKGTKMMMPSSDAPKDYVSMQHPQLFGLRVHPDLQGPLNFFFEARGPNAISAAVQGVNMAAKRMSVSFSAFHIKALFDAMLGAASNPISAVTTLYTLARGNNKALHELLHGGVGDKTDLALQGGLKIQMRKGAAVDDDVTLQFYEGLNSAGKLADRMFPGMGKIFKGVAKVNRFADVVMWEKAHAAMKLQTFYGRFDSVKRNLAKHADKDPNFKMPDDVAIAKDVAAFVNDSFGGLNWRRITENVQSHWGHELAQAAFSPKGRRAMQLMLFAPDWTLSTARAAAVAFGKGSGLKGVIHPQNVVDLHRNYLLRSAIIYSVAADTINMQMSGHHFWENEDPTRIDMGDGRTMQWSKHSMEAVHWFTNTQQQALNKLGILPKEALSQLLGVEYLTSRGEAPPMKSHIEHALKNFLPITGQSGGDIASAISSFFGMPIYGKVKPHNKFKTTKASTSKRHFK